ncbi:hypothetical protein ILUMI_02021 [Ignelater luminosus]|uniref:Uncharacterized protein n=1 Tax=Ignelater luminosus TaxID=2038154 RepID=A0A8K0GL71_IGNLU|nr:hypothetical protein ILUMI_02021 [Ignelater luminosus]
MKLIILLSGFATLALAAHLPSEIQICKRSDSNFKACLVSSADKALTVLANGYDELGFPSIEPIYLEETIIIEPRPGPINLYQKYNNIVIKGATKGKVEDFGINLDDCVIWLNHTLKPLDSSASYVIKGQLLLLPVDSKGDASLHIGEFYVFIKATCEKFVTGGKEYIRVVNVNLDITAKHTSFNYGPLFIGNPQLDQDIHKIIEDNPEDFFEVMRPSIEAMWGVGIMKLMNIVFTQIPLDELFW